MKELAIAHVTNQYQKNGKDLPDFQDNKWFVCRLFVMVPDITDSQSPMPGIQAKCMKQKHANGVVAPLSKYFMLCFNKFYGNRRHIVFQESSTKNDRRFALAP